MVFYDHHSPNDDNKVDVHMCVSSMLCERAGPLDAPQQLLALLRGRISLTVARSCLQEVAVASNPSLSHSILLYKRRI